MKEKYIKPVIESEEFQLEMMHGICEFNSTNREVVGSYYSFCDNCIHSGKPQSCG